MPDIRTLNYLIKVNEALGQGAELVVTTSCTECGLDMKSPMFNPAEHWVLPSAVQGTDVVVIGCEGYWQVEPASVGLENGNWCSIEGVNV